MNPLFKGILIGIVPAVVVDLRAFSSARAKDRTTRFDWALAMSNWASGAILGFAGAAGLEQI